MENVQIGVIKASDLFDSKYKLKIPEYQRPYVWDDEKCENLIKDYKEWAKIYQNNKERFYYMGSVLMHYDGGNYKIIDGQQRLTTLLILNYVLEELKKEDDETRSLENVFANRTNIEFCYSSPKSKEQITKNKDALKNLVQEHKIPKEIIERLIFSVVITQSEDDAFTFFDSQNSRGVPLAAVDFLKSYHLREIETQYVDSDREKVQIKFAKIWDENNTNQRLSPLFSEILWRGRVWKGNNIFFERKENILDEFQKKTKHSDKKEIKLYRGLKNKLASTMSFDVDNGATINMQPIALHTNSREYPLSLRQPIEKGISFFLYTEKYIELYNYIFETEDYNSISDSELSEFRKFYDTVIKPSFNDYFATFTKLCVITYFDNFETQGLYKFGLWLDYFLGSYRIYQSSIVRQTPVKILRDLSRNLLDVIHTAYTPEEVFEFLQEHTNDDWYDDSEVNRGVRWVYKDNLHTYFQDPVRLKPKDISISLKGNKKQWIREKLEKL